MKVGRQIHISGYIRPDQKKDLERLSKKTGLAQQELLREGLDMVIKKYGKNSRRSA